MQLLCVVGFQDSHDLGELGVTLDSKLNYNKKIDNVTQKATAALMQCKRAVGSMWVVGALTKNLQMDDGCTEPWSNP